jgi:hypothetical protein
MASSSLLGRLLLSVGAILLAGNAASLGLQYRAERGQIERAERARLETAAAMLVRQLDAGEHHALLERFPEQDHFLQWERGGEGLVTLQRQLAEASAELDAPIYTARLPEGAEVAVVSSPRDVHPEALELLVSSAEEPRWMHPAPFRPEMLKTLLHGERSATGLYQSTDGAWQSVFEPLPGADGAPEAMLVLNARPQALLDQAWGRLLQGLALAALTTLGALGAVFGITRSTARQLKALEAAALRLGEGDASQPLPYGGPREVVRLTRGLEIARRQIVHRVRAAREQTEQIEKKLSSVRQQIDPRALERRERIAAAGDQVQARVLLGIGRDEPCALVDLSHSEVVIAAPRDGGIDLAIGMPVTLQVQVGEEPSVTLRVVTLLRLEREDHLEVRFLLEEPLARDHGLPEGLAGLLDARGAERVFPANHAPLLVDIGAGGASLVADAAVENISRTGLAVRVPQTPSLAATWGTRLRLHLTLPGYMMPLELEARVRNVTDAMGGTRLGLAFDASAEGFAEKQAQIEEYIEERLRDQEHQEHLALAG